MADLRHLRYFMAVAEELSFTRAAARLNIAQPPLSQHIRTLEANLGATLFHRTKRRVELTEAGRVFLQYAYQAMRAMEQGKLLAQSVERGDAGRLAIGFLEYTWYTLMPPILRAFRDRSPGVEIVLRVFPNIQQAAALRSGQVDVSLLRPPLDERDIATMLISRERFILALPASHRLARRRRLSIRQFAQDPFVLYARELGPTFHNQILDFCAKAGFLPQAALEVSQIHAAVGLVSSGIGVALVPESAQRAHLDNVVYRPLIERAPDVDVLVAWHRERMNPVIRAFLDTCKRCAAGTASERADKRA